MVSWLKQVRVSLPDWLGDLNREIGSPLPGLWMLALLIAVTLEEAAAAFGLLPPDPLRLGPLR